MTDYAVVVGIAEYPGLTNLAGPDTDAQAVYDWLVDPAGGNLERENVELIRSAQFDPIDPQDPKPASGSVKAALLRIAAKTQQAPGNRLYMYFSGHGFAPTLEEGALFTAEASQLAPFHVYAHSWLKAFRRAGMFRDVVLWMDSCMNYQQSVMPDEAEMRISRSTKPPGPAFVGLAAQTKSALEHKMADGKVHGVFTWTLLEGLRGGASDERGRVTGESLKAFLQSAMPEFLPDEVRRAAAVDLHPFVRADEGMVFTRFAALGTCQKVLRSLRDDGLLLPRHQTSGLYAGQLVWKKPSDAAVYDILRNPAYAGAFVHGQDRAAVGLAAFGGEGGAVGVAAGDEDVFGGQAARGGRLAHRLHGADLVVGVLEADQQGVVAHGRGQLVGVDPAGGVDPDLGDLEPLAGQGPGRGQHRGVLDRRHDQVTAAPGRPGQPGHGKVGGLGAAGGEHQLLGGGPDGRGQLLSRPVQQHPGPPSPPVQPRGVAEAVQGLQQRRPRPGVQGSGGGGVQIGLGNGAHHSKRSAGRTHRIPGPAGTSASARAESSQPAAPGPRPPAPGPLPGAGTPEPDPPLPGPPVGERSPPEERGRGVVHTPGARGGEIRRPPPHSSAAVTPFG